MKISIVGCGKVGSAIAYTALLQNLADEIVLVDASEDKARGEAMDILQCRAFAPQARVYQGQMADTKDSRVIVVTAGIPRKADEPRVLLLSRNAELIGDIVAQVVRYSPDGILLMVTNPMDVMTQLAFTVSKWPRERVIGMGTVLDTSRYRAYIADRFGADARDVDAYVIGEHGETMVPLKSGIRLRGIPLEQWPQFSPQTLDQIVQDVIAASGQVIALKGGTVFAPAVSACTVLSAIIRNTRSILPVCAYQPSVELCISLPAVVDENGASQALELNLTHEERALFNQSADNIRTYVADLAKYIHR